MCQDDISVAELPAGSSQAGTVKLVHCWIHGGVALTLDMSVLQQQYPSMAAFKDLWPEVRQAVSGTFLQIVLRYADIFVTDSHSTPSDAALAANAWVAEAPSATQAGYTGFALTAPGTSMGGARGGKRDGAASLLRCLSALLDAHGGGAAVASGAESFSHGMPPETLEAFVGLVRFAGRCAVTLSMPMTSTRLMKMPSVFLTLIPTHSVHILKHRFLMLEHFTCLGMYMSHFNGCKLQNSQDTTPA